MNGLGRCMLHGFAVFHAISWRTINPGGALLNSCPFHRCCSLVPQSAWSVHLGPACEGRISFFSLVVLTLSASRESGTAVSIRRLRNGTRGRSYVGKLFVMHTQGDMRLCPQQANKSSRSLVPSSDVPPTPQSAETLSCFQKLPGSQHHRY